MRIVILTSILMLSFFCNSQNYRLSDISNITDSITKELTDGGVTKIISLILDRNPSETYNSSDTCYDCSSGFIFWQRDDTTFLKKINRRGSFKINYQPVDMDYADLNFSDLFNFISYKTEEFETAEIRPSTKDLIDSSRFDVTSSDTTYFARIWPLCSHCKSVTMSINYEGLSRNYSWKSLHFDKNSNKDFYLENLNSRIYHLYLLALFNINHYDRNKFWKKE